MRDVVVIGGGVIGLSAAYQLAREGCRVRVLDQNSLGSEASWAGAGMLPPGMATAMHSQEAWLRGNSAALWDAWAHDLTHETGMDLGYRRCGSVEVRPLEDTAAVTAEIASWSAESVEVQPLNSRELAEQFPSITSENSTGYWLPGCAQVRNPRLLKGLMTACAQRGVILSPGTAVTRFTTLGPRIVQVETNQGSITADQFVVATGAWSQALLAPLGLDLKLTPIRGQIVLLNQLPQPIRTIVQSGLRYLVPRADGRILIGATEEDVGFDKRNTAAGVHSLLTFAQQLVPALRDAQIERCWAGLRPGRPGGLPFIGRAPTTENLVVAAGHFRAGLQLSPITAHLVADLVCGRPCRLPAKLWPEHSQLA